MEALREIVAAQPPFPGADAAGEAAAADEETLRDFLARCPPAPDAQRHAADAQAVLRAAEGYSAALAGVRGEVDAALEAVGAIRAQYAAVTTDSRMLHESCERLLAEQTQLELQVGQLEPLLAHFNELEAIGKLLGLPLTGSEAAASAITADSAISPASDEFDDVLARLDAAIDFFVSHPHFAEAATYLAKMRQLLRRALSLLRTHVVAVLDGVVHKLSALPPARLSLEESSPLFVRYRAVAAQVGRWTQKIEARVGMEGTDFAPLVRDCHAALYDGRLALLLPLVRARVAALAAQHDVLGLARVGVRVLRGICDAERRLFGEFFARPDAECARVVDPEGAALRAALGELCGELYGALRPLVIHEQSIDVLCELVDVLRSELSADGAGGAGDAQAGLGLEPMIERLVQDTQERLIYETQTYVREQVRGFQPAAADLDYPARLAAERRPEDAGAYYTWYPTVERTLMCLSKIYRCVETSIFEGLAQEAVAVCTASLMAAAARVKAPPSVGALREVDRMLFLVHNLLTLREQITPFDIDFCATNKSLDFSPTTGALTRFLGQGRNIFALSRDNALLGLVMGGIPRVTETREDAKQRLELDLKEACGSFIATVSRAVLGPESGGPGSGSVVEQLAAVEARAAELLPQVRAKLALYLANAETEAILFRPVQAAVLEGLAGIKGDSMAPEVERAYAAARAATG